MLIAILLLAGGLSLLPFVADRFVVAASRVSRSLGISEILVGALLVGFGTSLPEMVVSGIAAAKDDPDFAVANIVGSNVANLTLVLGVAAVMSVMVVERRVLQREGALVLGVTALYVLLLLDNETSRPEAVLLLVVMVGALLLLFMWSKGRLDESEDIGHLVTVRRELVTAAFTMALTVLAATALIEGAERLADELEIESAFIAISLVAVGTSLPELATGVAAVRHGEGGLVLGNVLGSNLFNSLAVGGISGLIGPGAIDEGFRELLFLMLGITLLAGILTLRQSRLTRLEGFVLLAVFAGFIAFAGPALA